jgi:hypothetical protein
VTVLGSVDLSDSGARVVTVDADPRSTAVDARVGSLIFYNGDFYRKLDSGSTTNVALVWDYGYWQSAVNEARTSTTGEDTVRVTLTTPATSGIYLIQWTATIDSDNKVAELSLYNSTDAAEVDYWKFKTADADYRHVVSGFYFVTLTGLAKTFQLRWGNEPGETNTIYISAARLVGWRVS